MKKYSKKTLAALDVIVSELQIQNGSIKDFQFLATRAGKSAVARIVSSIRQSSNGVSEIKGVVWPGGVGEDMRAVCMQCGIKILWYEEDARQFPIPKHPITFTAHLIFFPTPMNSNVVLAGFKRMGWEPAGWYHLAALVKADKLQPDVLYVGLETVEVKVESFGKEEIKKRVTHLVNKEIQCPQFEVEGKYAPNTCFVAVSK